ncbi:MAG TPA: glutamate racemase [Polyangia bacterium]|nr:glutamate racemase [Polyangia bacterium]
MIGVFDSGFGGLTVLSALVDRLPAYDYLYLGDSARTPYGGRSHEAVYQFTREAVEFLFDAGCPLVILACNTASARALRTLQHRHLPVRRPDRRILGVVRPAAEALAGIPADAVPGATSPVADADAGTMTGAVAVLGTAGTIASDSYRLELAKLAPRLGLVQQACPLWVPLVEAGELDGAGTEFFLRKYLDPVLAAAPRPDRILLACTHYPLLLPAIRRVVDQTSGGGAIQILEQGQIVADRLATWMTRHPEMEPRLGRGGTRRYLTTDDPDWFAGRAAALLGRPITAEAVRLPVVD